MKKSDTISCLLTAVMAVCASSASFAAASFDINSVRAATAARLVSEKYGVDIRLNGVRSRLVTLSISNADGQGARLDAVNTLANALHATFTKVYVVTKTDGDAAYARVDSTSRVPFSQTSLSAADAITRIADADNALAQIVGDLDGSVTLSAPSLPVTQAMTEIASQTHTSWRTVYVLTPRDAPLSADQRIVGRTASGAPILQMAHIIYDNPERDARLQREADNARKQAEQQQAQMLAAQKQAEAQQASAATNASAGGNTAIGNAAYGNGYPGVRYPSANSGAYSGNGLVVLGGSATSAGAMYFGANTGR